MTDSVLITAVFPADWVAIAVGDDLLDEMVVAAPELAAFLSDSGVRLFGYLPGADGTIDVLMTARGGVSPPTDTDATIAEVEADDGITMTRSMEDLDAESLHVSYAFESAGVGLEVAFVTRAPERGDLEDVIELFDLIAGNVRLEAEVQVAGT